MSEDKIICHDYLGRGVRVFQDDCGVYDLEIDGGICGEVYYDFENKKYSVHDGAEGYGWHDSINEAIEYYMDIEYKENLEVDVPKCIKCGDGGCFHCEPYRFL